MSRWRLARCIWGLSASLAAAGCSPTPEDLCEDFCDCEGCSESELDECLEEAADMQSKAEDESCTVELDAYVSCVSDESRCSGESLDRPACRVESELLDECMGGSGPCAAYCEACGLDPDMCQALGETWTAEQCQQALDAVEQQGGCYPY